MAHIPPQLREALRAALDGSTPAQRAAIIQETVQAAYDHAKHRDPAGEGDDGRDGTERRALGDLLGAAITHHDRTIRAEHGIPERAPTVEDLQRSIREGTYDVPALARQLGIADSHARLLLSTLAEHDDAPSE